MKRPSSWQRTLELMTGDPRMKYRNWFRNLAVALVLSLALAACAAKKPPAKPTGPTPEQLAAAAAEKAAEEKAEADRVAAEQDALAKQAEEEEAARQKAIAASQLPKEFGTPQSTGAAPEGKSGEMREEKSGVNVTAIAPVYVPQKLPPPNIPGATPYDKAFPAIQDKVVRIGIMSGSSQAESAQIVSRMLSDEERKYMEETLGLGMKIAYVSETDLPQTQRTRVKYRPEFLKAAVHIAALLPQPQQLAILSEADATRHGVDILVQIGTDLH